MKRVINRETQEGIFNFKWLAVAVLILIVVVRSVSDGFTQEPQQAEPNAPTGKVKKDSDQTDTSGEAVKDQDDTKDQDGNKDEDGTKDEDDTKKDDDGNKKDEDDNSVHADEPNEVPPVAPPAAKPTTRSPAKPAALRAGFKRAAWDIGPEIYSFKYEEPPFLGFSGIKEEGIFYGLRFGFTFRDWVPASSKKSSSDGGAMLRAEGRFAFGQVDYDGSLSDGTPYTIDNIDDFTFEGRLLLGADMLLGDSLNTLYAGIGYRYLNDDSSFDPAGYERESNYLYVPVGYQLDSSHKAGWSLGFGAEFDLFLIGEQKSYLSKFGFNDVYNRQSSGYGYRASVRLQQKSKYSIFAIEPFYRYWDIDDSEVEYDPWGIGWIEPANETSEIGIQLIWIF
ncbi:MAG: hypothetical protein ACYSW0_20225 [Planctomycetota bacterium]|jgi:hypothetical protein